MRETKNENNAGLLGRVAAKYRKFADFMAGRPSPEEEERRHIENERLRAYSDAYSCFIDRYGELVKRQESELGLAEFLRKEVLKPAEAFLPHPYPTRDALESAFLDHMHVLDKTHGDWQTLIDGYAEFIKKPQPGREPEDFVYEVRQADGMCRLQMKVSEMRKAFRLAAERSGLVVEEQMEIPAETQSSVQIMKPLKLCAKAGGGTTP